MKPKSIINMTMNAFQQLKKKKKNIQYHKKSLKIQQILIFLKKAKMNS